MLDNAVPKHTTRIDLIFDSYLDESPKAFERLRRGVKGFIALSAIDDYVPLPKQFDKFWASNDNKALLQSYIKESVLKNRAMFRQEAELFCSATIGSVRTSCISSDIHNEIEEHPELLYETLEEADFRIMPHVMHATKQGISEVISVLFVLLYRRINLFLLNQILILSPDVDVVVLALHHWKAFHSHGLKVR